jgi:hypothetical protein
MKNNNQGLSRFQILCFFAWHTATVFLDLMDGRGRETHPFALGMAGVEPFVPDAGKIGARNRGQAERFKEIINTRIPSEELNDHDWQASMYLCDVMIETIIDHIDPRRRRAEKAAWQRLRDGLADLIRESDPTEGKDLGVELGCAVADEVKIAFGFGPPLTRYHAL